jgi:hypothetical protein
MGLTNGAELTDLRSPTVPRPLNVRTAFSNGKRAFLQADGRSREGRLLIDREREFGAMIGNTLNVSERTRVQAAAVLSVRLELARSELARGAQGTTADDLVRMSNALRRELAGIEAIAAGRKSTQDTWSCFIP